MALVIDQKAGPPGRPAAPPPPPVREITGLSARIVAGLAAVALLVFGIGGCGARRQPGPVPSSPAA